MIGIDVVENTVWKGELTQVTGLVASFNQNITRFYSRVIFNRMSEGEVTGFVTGTIFFSVPGPVA